MLHEQEYPYVPLESTVKSGYSYETYETPYGIIPVAQICNPGKEKLYFFPGFGGYPDPSGEVLDELSRDYWPIELGEPLRSVQPNLENPTQNVIDSLAFETYITEHDDPEEQATYIGASYGAITLAKYALRNQHRVKHALFPTPAGLRQRDNLAHLSLRYLREAVRTNYPAIKREGIDGLISALGTTRKAKADLRATLNRMRSTVSHSIASDIYALGQAGVLTTIVVGADDGLFTSREITNHFRNEITRIHQKEQGEEGLIYAAALDEEYPVYEVPGAHDLGFTGQPRAYAKLLKDQIDRRITQRGR